MAQRDLYDGRTVIEQVADIKQPDVIDTSGGLLAVGADIVKQVADYSIKIQEQNEKTKILEASSQAELEIEDLKNRISVEYESNPVEGYNQFQKQRTAIVGGKSKEISRYFQADWRNVERQIVDNSNLTMTKWRNAQTQKNTVASINRSIKNNLMQAQNAGVAFGVSDDEGIDALTGYFGQREKLEGVAASELGSETARDMLEGYDEDYIKTFISGVAESNPVKALALIDDEVVKEAFGDSDKYTRMKDAVESRALNFSKINGERDILRVLKSQNAVLTQSGQKPMSYAELETALDQTQASPYARSFFMKLNGFKGEDGESVSAQPQGELASTLPSGKLSDGQKSEYKQKLLGEIMDFSRQENPSSEKLLELQELTYYGIENKSITREEGFGYIGTYLSSYADVKEKQLQKYGDDNWIRSTDTGIAKIKNYIKDNVDIKLKKDEDSIFDDNEATAEIARRKALLYSAYERSLTAQAQEKGFSQFGQILSLPKKEKDKIFNTAYEEAIGEYAVNRSPRLQLIPRENWPSAVITPDGEMFPVKAGANPKVDIPAEIPKVKDIANLREMIKSGLLKSGDVFFDESAGVRRVIPEGFK